MPPELQDVHQIIGREMYLLWTKWKYFKRLYCKDDETVRLLNSAGAFFFRIVEDLFRDDVILTICRLTDPPRTKVAGKEKINLTLSYLAELVPASESSLVANLADALKQVDVKCERFRPHRNRRIGHYDLDTRQRQPSARLPAFNLADVDGVLDSFADILNAIESHYNNNTQSYASGIYGPGNADDLIEFVERNEKLERYFQTKEYGDRDDSERDERQL